MLQRVQIRQNVLLDGFSLCSACFLVIILWLRLYSVRKSGRKMIDKIDLVLDILFGN
jgi:hypothetical protein